MPEARKRKNIPAFEISISFPYNTAKATNVPHPKARKSWLMRIGNALTKTKRSKEMGGTFNYLFFVGVFNSNAVPTASEPINIAVEIKTGKP